MFDDFYLVRLWLGCIPKISFLACLEVPQKFVWVVVESKFSDRLWLSFSLALAKPDNFELTFVFKTMIHLFVT